LDSVLSDSNGLRRLLDCLSRRVAEQRNIGRASAEAAVDFAAIAFWASTKRKTKQKQKEPFRRAK
jgi:hypothetical protein